MNIGDFGTNFGSAVLKRDSRSFSDVRNHLTRNGWVKTGDVNGRFHHFENSGLNITVVDGPRATLIFPSGPIRGRIFSSVSSGFTNSSPLGLGSSNTGSNSSRSDRSSSSSESDVVMV